jgi:hypothetical protein
LLNRYRISVLQDQKSYGANGGEGWGINIMNGFNTFKNC